MEAFVAALGPLAGRVMLACVFAYSGYQKLFAATGRAVSSLAGKGIPSATLAAYGAGTFEIVVAFLIITGLKARLAALAAIAYLIVVTWVFHWRPALRGDTGQMIQLLKNVGIAGGMLLLVCYGPGRASIDRA